MLFQHELNRILDRFERVFHSFLNKTTKFTANCWFWIQLDYTKCKKTNFMIY
jgi:hypothetical protein